MTAVPRGLQFIVLAAVVAACGAAPSIAPVTAAASTSALVPTSVPVSTQIPALGATLPPAATIQVTLGLYSGRPDPVWALTAGERDKLAVLIAALPVVQGVPPQGGLGYHGFVIAITTADGSVMAVTSYANTVSPAGGVANRYWRDENRVVERYLLETGKAALADAEYAIVIQALDDPQP